MHIALPHGFITPFAVFAAPEILPDIPKTGSGSSPFGVVLLALGTMAVIAVPQERARISKIKARQPGSDPAD